MGLSDLHIDDDMQKYVLVLMMIAMRGVFELLEVYFEMLVKNIDLFCGGRRRVRAKRFLRWNRVKFHEFSVMLAEVTFRGVFRMSKHSFHKLCIRVSNEIGENNFLPQALLDNIDRVYSIPYRLKNLMIGRACDFGGDISGEIKLAICIRILAGGSYWDIAPCWGVHSVTIHRVFRVVLDWFSSIPFGTMDLGEYLRFDDSYGKSVRESIKKGFSVSSGGVLDGCIWVLDGWVVKVMSTGNTSMYSRKGFNGINIQLLGDHLKRVL